MASLSKPTREVDALRMIIDYGSGFLKVAAQHALAGRPVDEVSIDDIPLKPGRKQLEQKIVLDGDDILCGTSEVRTWAARHPDQLHRIIESHKLCLCAKYRQKPAALRVWKALDAESGDLIAIQNLISRHLRWIREAVIGFYRNRHPKSMRYPQAYWDNLQIECIITVPGNWGHEELGIMRNAAHNAGLPKANIKLEPVCAAGLDMDEMFKHDEIGYDDEVCFSDIGKSTCDLGTVRMARPAEDGNRPTLVVVGDTMSEDAGAQIVNDAAEKYLLTHPRILQWGGIEATSRRLGNMSESEFVTRFLDEFELRKKDFPHELSYAITVISKPGWNELPGCEPNIVIEIPWANMESMYRSWTDLMVDTLKAHLNRPEQANCRTVILTGASRTNDFVREELDKALHGMARRMFVSTSDSPVTHGGLRQYVQHKSAKLPTGYFYLIRGEECNRHHKHGRDQSPPHNSRRRLYSRNFQRPEQYPPRRFDKKCHWDEVDECWVLDDRVRLFMTNVPGQAPETVRIPMDFTVDADAPPRLLIHVYHSSDRVADHTSLRNADGSIRSCYSECSLQFADLPDPVQHGFTENKVDRDTAFYKITGIVELAASHEHLAVTISLLQPREQFRYQNNRNGKSTEILLPGAKHRTFFSQTQE